MNAFANRRPGTSGMTPKQDLNKWILRARPVGPPGGARCSDCLAERAG
eukprot:CAMPEP_0115454994 /NCGR_PEP_ID=MMETSP0271-20121206/43929_1 /TAXON_ID=71861 /ORGANISM="Scrippsiella trochoidea, Strain CCMP3099" /LENGTH=47 /DNA_ID= /DNA_START= /DNA_END= /DNA_ORIENTATION=